MLPSILDRMVKASAVEGAFKIPVSSSIDGIPLRSHGMPPFGIIDIYRCVEDKPEDLPEWTFRKRKCKEDQDKIKGDKER